MRYPRIIIASTQSAAGKTTITLGVLLALRKMGLSVQPFKTGPDYIDPMFHTRVCRNICRNLDSWLLKPNAILELFERQAKKADISVVEAVMGLYDGVAEAEQGSSGHLAKILKAPVILIINAASLSRSAAAVALGYKAFDKKVNIAGIILNNIANQRHYQYVRIAVEEKTAIPVLGFLPKDVRLKLPERHLGLVSAAEKRLNGGFYRRLLAVTEKNINIRHIIKISRSARNLPCARKNIFGIKRRNGAVSIAVARDEAFNFYYQDNLDILKHLGARLIFFSPLNDRMLPQDIGGIYIGGGYPEVFAKKLSKNIKMKAAVYENADLGMPVYAECGGLMYLAKKLVDFQKKAFPMAGVFDCSALMGNKRQALGYIELEAIKDNILSRQKDKIRAHIFHWSYLKLNHSLPFAYRARKNQDEFYDGLIYKNVLAGYAHIHFGSNLNFARNFIKSCRDYKRKR